MKHMTRRQIDKVERDAIKNLGLGLMMGCLLLLIVRLLD
jgi:hypothetical protein